jgi:hypothetical protein
VVTLWSSVEIYQHTQRTSQICDGVASAFIGQPVNVESGFNPGPVHSPFMVHEVVKGHIFLQLFQFSSGYHFTSAPFSSVYHFASAPFICLQLTL